MRFKAIGAAALAGMLTIAATAPVIADGHAVYEQRETAMKTLGMNLQGLMKGQITDVAAAAATIKEVFDGLPELFPEGSNAGGSEAKAEIWTDWEAFTAIISRGSEGATALADAAASGGDIKVALGAIGGTCQDCHSTYRAK